MAVFLTGIFQLSGQELRTYSQKMQSFFSDLDSTEFKFDILYNRVYPWAHLTGFADNVTDTSSAKHFEQALNELYLASGKKHFLPNSIFRSIRFTYVSNGKVPVGIIHTAMTVLSPDAFDEDDPKIYIDSTDANNIKLKEVAGKDPYENLDIVVISPLIETVKQKAQQGVDFIFGKPYFDYGTHIKSLTVDFRDGGKYTIIQDGEFINRELTHTFSSSGSRTIKYEIVMKDGRQITTFSKVNVEVEDQTASRSINCAESPRLRFRRPVNFTQYEPDHYDYNSVGAYEWTVDIDNPDPMLKYKIFYACGRNRIENPIIITDGFDPVDSRKVNDLYYDLYYLNGNIEMNFGDELRQMGYDVIMVNFPIYRIGTAVLTIPTVVDEYGYPERTEEEIVDVPRYGGVDYIERNGKLLAKFIQMINDSLMQNVGSQHNGSVLVGPSMGGLITRWALTELEQQNYDHKVRIWVSFDSPHQGANIPTSLQWLDYYLENVSNYQIDGLDEWPLWALYAPAARQMLVDHINNRSGNRIRGADHAFYDRFYSAINNQGFPQHTRKLALVNGSFMGETIGDEGEDFLSITGDLWRNNNHKGRVFSMDLYYANNDQTPTFVMDVSNWANHFRNLVDIPEEFMGFANLHSSYGNYDIAPGSKFPYEFDDIELENLHLGWGYVLVFSRHYNGENVSFIPIKSSLAFSGANKILDENLCEHYGNLVALHYTPFDSYYAPVENQNHCQLTSGSVNWLKNELTVGPQPPFPDGSLCRQPLVIEGPRFLCPGNQGKYYTNISGNVNWDVTGMTIVAQPAPDTVIVELNNANHMGTLTATLSGYIDASKNIFCLPDFDVHVFNDGRDIGLIPAGGTTFADQGVTDVTWELTEGNGFLVRADNYGAEVDMQPDYYGTVTVTNAKGSVTKPIFGPDPDKCYILKKVEEDKYEVIDRCSGYQTITAMPIKEIYDQYGTKLQDAPVVNGKIDVSGSGQSGDIRIIHVVVNGKNVSKMIIKD